MVARLQFPIVLCFAHGAVPPWCAHTNACACLHTLTNSDNREILAWPFKKKNCLLFCCCPPPMYGLYMAHNRMYVYTPYQGMLRWGVNRPPAPWCRATGLSSSIVWHKGKGVSDHQNLWPPERIDRWAHRPAGRAGNATDLSFLSSAAERQFFTVFSSWSSHFSEPHWGTLQWMMKRAAIPLAWLTATAECKHKCN